MTLQTNTFTSFVQQAAAGVQGSLTALVNLATGSATLAIEQASAAIDLWLQWMVLQVLALTRAATSNGPDLDTWLADFGFARTGAATATGAVTFSRYSNGIAALIVPWNPTTQTGAQIKTIDGTQTFNVTIDTTNGLWNAGMGGYLVPSGTNNATVPVAAAVAGTGGNVQAGTITVISASIPYIDTVTNALAYTNGVNAESDAAARAGFVAFINDRTAGTDAACVAAAIGVQSNLIAAMFDNTDSSGNAKPGYAVIVLDDGTGAPGSTVLNNAAAAVQAVAASDVPIAVVGPTVTGATVVIATTPPTGVSRSSYDAAVVSAVTAMIDALAIGATLVYSQIGITAATAAPSGTVFTTITLNGGTSSLTPTGPISVMSGLNMGVVRAASVTCA